jgi:hypothetical protein
MPESSALGFDTRCLHDRSHTLAYRCEGARIAKTAIEIEPPSYPPNRA